MARYLVGIDNGGTMSKAAVFTEDGRELAAASRKVEILEPYPGWSERDMEAMQLVASALGMPARPGAG